jgi:uncharacterized lipoprotein YddW (UPF0748 family)
MNHGWYYLHANGSLIYKTHYPDRERDFKESDLVIKYWRIDGTQQTMQRIYEELSSDKGLKVNQKDLVDFAIKWNVNL